MLSLVPGTHCIPNILMCDHQRIPAGTVVSCILTSSWRKSTIDYRSWLTNQQIINIKQLVKSCSQHPRNVPNCLRILTKEESRILSSKTFYGCLEDVVGVNPKWKRIRLSSYLVAILLICWS